MLGAAGFAGLYGLVHLFDMARRSPEVAAPAEAEAPVTDERGDLLVYLEEDEPELLLDAEPEVAEVSETPEVAEEVQPEVAELVQESEPEVVEPEPVADVVQKVEPEAAEPVQDVTPIEPAHEEPDYSPVAPLFEAEPFVRKQRAAFGRRRAG